MEADPPDDAAARGGGRGPGPTLFAREGETVHPIKPKRRMACVETCGDVWRSCVEYTYGCECECEWVWVICMRNT